VYEAVIPWKFAYAARGGKDQSKGACGLRRRTETKDDVYFTGHGIVSWMSTTAPSDGKSTDTIRFVLSGKQEFSFMFNVPRTLANQLSLGENEYNKDNE
jgi:hypothetical protein